MPRVVLSLMLTVLLASQAALAVDGYGYWCEYSRIPATAPASRFTDNDDGTVTDKANGLHWKRCSEGQTWSGGTCTGATTSHSWQEALQLAEGATDLGYTDWRLPNIKELSSIIERACSSPAIDLAVFPATSATENMGWFWSASTSIPVGGEGVYGWGAWLVDFDRGHVRSQTKDSGLLVRLVRGGH